MGPTAGGRLSESDPSVGRRQSCFSAATQAAATSGRVAESDDNAATEASFGSPDFRSVASECTLRVRALILVIKKLKVSGRTSV